MGSWFSRDAGSMSSVTEAFAFPYAIANQSHIPTDLWSYEDIKFAVLDEEKSTNNKVIIFCHGNCMTVSKRTISMLRKFQSEVKAPIYMLEYPGYGESSKHGTSKLY